MEPSSNKLDLYCLQIGWEETNLSRSTSATSVLTSVKDIRVVPSGGDKMDVRRENTDVRWVGFHSLLADTSNLSFHLLKAFPVNINERSSLFGKIVM